MNKLALLATLALALPLAQARDGLTINGRALDDAQGRQLAQLETGAA